MCDNGRKYVCDHTHKCDEHLFKKMSTPLLSSSALKFMIVYVTIYLFINKKPILTIDVDTYFTAQARACLLYFLHVTVPIFFV